MLLSTQAGNGLTPVGGIIVWPKDSDPSTSSNIWLECNGQTFDTSRFPKLYKVLGSNRVPNYQGMFLRGAGTQTFSQVNDKYNGTTATSYSSGNIGNIQGDSARRYISFFGHPIGASTGYNAYEYGLNAPGTIEVQNGIYIIENQGTTSASFAAMGTSTLPMIGGTNAVGMSNLYSSDWQDALRKTKYNLHYSTSTDKDGNQVIDDISLEEYQEEPPELYFHCQYADIVFDTELKWPTSNEFRPVNIAVKYYIRAK